MSQRNKKYNPRKRINFIASHKDKLFRTLFADVGIVCNLLDMTQSRVIAKNKIPEFRKAEIIKHLFEHKHDWMVYCAVCIKEPNGKDNLKTLDLGVSSQVLFADIADGVEQAHKDFLYSFVDRLNLVTGYAFVCYPSRNKRSDDELLMAFKDSGCFDSNHSAFLNADGDIEFKDQIT